jgi:periplasmic divalent cation tolerance protein
VTAQTGSSMEPDMEPTVSVVLCTVPAESARSLADRLLGARLIACANLVGPVESRFWWEGRIDEADEILLVMKTTSERIPELIESLVEWHPYDVPEILELPVGRGHAAYLAWVAESCRAEGG